VALCRLVWREEFRFGAIQTPASIDGPGGLRNYSVRIFTEDLLVSPNHYQAVLHLTALICGPQVTGETDVVSERSRHVTHSARVCNTSQPSVPRLPQRALGNPVGVKEGTNEGYE
jgi:hypothetical protein